MEVAGDDLGPEREELLEPRDRRLERRVGLEVVEVADVRPEHRLVAAREAEGVLELRADGEHRPREAAARRATGRGTNPRERRITSGRPATVRATESSQREAIGRSWTRNRSAIAPSRASASSSSNAIGSSERFPLVITSGRPAAARRRWWSGA